MFRPFGSSQRTETKTIKRRKTVFDRTDLAEHLFSIPELDFSNDLLVERIPTPWFRLGAWTRDRRRDERNVEEEIFRQAVLLHPESFSEIFDQLKAIGNLLGDLGKPKAFVSNFDGKQEYGYEPFHQAPFRCSKGPGETLVFVRWDTNGPHLFVSPDLWLFLELEEKVIGSGIWWDPRKGVEALRHHVVDQGNLELVEIRTEYLLKYLQTRQMALLIAHYRQLLLFDPSQNNIAAFVKEGVTVGSAAHGAKGILDNWGLSSGIVDDVPFLQRRLHLWYEIKPPEIDLYDPWTDPAPFDLYEFTLPTRSGAVAPARWRHTARYEGAAYAGNTCDFMDLVYFRQEALMKYENVSGFEIGDDGSVRSNYWSFHRSVARLGNELLGIAIGDFAEGVTLSEWPHWQQFAVEPPSIETLKVLREEQTIPSAVNALIGALQKLSRMFYIFGDFFGVKISDDLWLGSEDSLAARQLKWCYPVSSHDDEFLKRATLISTLVIEALSAPALRAMLMAIDESLHLNNDIPPRSLGSRNLLQRLTVLAVIVERFRPKLTEIAVLVRIAEGKRTENSSDLEAELELIHKTIKQEFAPLAFLYDIRTHAGIAHRPNHEYVETAATQLGLPGKNWSRRDYLRLLNLSTAAIDRISDHLWVTISPGPRSSTFLR